jgi:DNA replication protein DnaC
MSSASVTTKPTDSLSSVPKRGKPKRDYDASVVGGPKGSSALAYVARKAAEAQGRMDALAAAGKTFVPVYRRVDDPAENLRRAMDAAMASDWQAMTLDRFNGYTKELREAATHVAAFIEEPRGMLYITGGIGTGKTHLAAGTAIRLIERGYPVRVYRATDVATMLRGAVAENSVETVMNRLKNVRVLVIDDFGTEHMTDFLASEWFDIFDYRYRQHAATIITSNLHPDDLGMPRLASRFRDDANATVITVTAKDFRILPHRPPMTVAASDYAPPAAVAPPCKTCGGLGVVKCDLPIGHRHFGRVFLCPTCRGGVGEPMRNGGER